MDRNFRDHSRKVVTRVAAAFKCIQETSASDTFKQLASKSNKLSLLLTRRTEALVAEVEENSLSLYLSLITHLKAAAAAANWCPLPDFPLERER